MSLWLAVQTWRRSSAELTSPVGHVSAGDADAEGVPAGQDAAADVRGRRGGHRHDAAHRLRHGVAHLRVDRCRVICSQRLVLISGLVRASTTIAFFLSLHYMLPTHTVAASLINASASVPPQLGHPSVDPASVQLSTGHWRPCSCAFPGRTRTQEAPAHCCWQTNVWPEIVHEHVQPSPFVSCALSNSTFC